MLKSSRSKRLIKKELERGGWPAPIAEAYAENGGTPHLDRRHTVFGHLVDEASYKVLDEIANVEVGTQDMRISLKQSVQLRIFLKKLCLMKLSKLSKINRNTNRDREDSIWQAL